MDHVHLDRVKISITNACNLGCKHCYLNEDNRVFLDSSYVLSILQDCYIQGVRVVDFTGGEPTLHPSFSFFVNKAYVYGLNINVSTNGLNLENESILSVLKKSNANCHISLDAVSDKKLSLIRGNGVFSRLDRIFSTLKSRGVQFSLRCSLNKLNYQDVPEIIGYANRIGANISFGATQLRGHADKSIILSDADFQWVKEQILASRMNGTINIDIEECFTAFCPCDGASMSILSINHFGNPVCCLMMSTETNVDKNLPKSAHLSEMLDQISCNKQKLSSFRTKTQCNHCQYKMLCKSGCLVTANALGCI